MAAPDILDGTVDDLRDALPEYDDDLQELLAAERDGKDRSTAIDAIQEEMERRGEEPATADDLLAGSVDDLRESLPDFEGDLQDLLAAEREGKDRKTAIAAIEEEMKRRAESPPVPLEDSADTAGDGTGDGDGSGNGGFSMASIRDRIQHRLEEISAEGAAEMTFEANGKQWIRSGVPGFDELFENGIPRGSPILVAGGAGAGKTIFTLQIAAAHAAHGEKVLYMSFEESVEALKTHMRSFGWDPDTLIAEDMLRLQKYSPFDITRKVEAVLAKEKGELMIDIDPVILPADFQPDIVVVDSLTAVASAFTGETQSYRIYIDTLFDFFESIDATSFLITETAQEPEQFSPTGVEEFLADGVIVMYNFRRGDVRESAIEVLKMRGAKHKRQMAAMQITGNGIRVYPNQSVFGAMED